MSFRFNFPQLSDSETSGILNSASSSNKLTSKSEDKEVLGPCDYISIQSIKLENIEEVSILKVRNLHIAYVGVKSLKMITDNETFTQVEVLNTDLIPGKYEGGMKMWECSLDLAELLVDTKCIKNGDLVLELGCGNGIPGIIAYMQGASVTFQDFNSEVLRFVTCPNVLLNTRKGRFPDDSPDVCRFIYGDWGSIHKKFYSDEASAEKYDVILSSETIYAKSNQKKLLELMKSTLKPDGTIYLAAKAHYFGVGGGITDFEMLLKVDGTFEIVSRLKTTLGLEREILKLKFKNK